MLGWLKNWYTTSTSGIKIAVLESHFQDILQRQLARNREDHGVCYHRPGRDEHVPINKKVLDSWVQQLCRGFATGLEPPQGLLDSSGIEQGMSDIGREAMSSWLKPKSAPVILWSGNGADRDEATVQHQDHHVGWEVLLQHKTCGGAPKGGFRYPGKWLLINTYTAFISGLGTSEEANIGRVIVVLAYVIDLMVFIEDSPAKMVPRNFLVTAMLSPRYSHLGGYL
ncbi:hypothetical protein BU17DRAFT_68627 [Hysterangium stoloniferum]|nr:hypothetical protein BU17DRAFT_68627 [Hysterangium stoloniferum]